MRNAIWIICLCFLLTGCHRNLSESISLEVKSDLKTVESKIEKIKVSIPEQCSKAIENDLNSIYDDVRLSQSKIDNITQACKIEKQEINSKVMNRNLVIVLLLLVIAFILYKK